MSEKRKNDHIELAFKSQVSEKENHGLYYEPLLGSHQKVDLTCYAFGHELKAPLWVSSMTGGAERAKDINKRLALACQKFGLAMGLGSCRPLLESDERLADFQIRKYIGEQPLYANLGIAQLEELIEAKKMHAVSELLKKLDASGLIIHVNPLQEALQFEGDQFKFAPIQTIERTIDALDQTNIIVKEVGQGMGPNSLKLLLDLPIKGIELSAFGGTNFSFLEHSRHIKKESATLEPLLDFAYVGHTAQEMLSWINTFAEQNSLYKEKSLIISGGIQSIIQGHSLLEQSNLNAVIGFASKYLKPAMDSQEVLDEFIETQINSLSLCKNFLRRS